MATSRSVARNDRQIIELPTLVGLYGGLTFLQHPSSRLTHWPRATGGRIPAFTIGFLSCMRIGLQAGAKVGACAPYRILARRLRLRRGCERCYHVSSCMSHRQQASLFWPLLSWCLYSGPQPEAHCRPCAPDLDRYSVDRPECIGWGQPEGRSAQRQRRRRQPITQVAWAPASHQLSATRVHAHYRFGSACTTSPRVHGS